ncbi:MAG TPA: PEP-CTERM sorting domain-containing protein, partial [Isosphaeraceae bacterium]
ALVALGAPSVSHGQIYLGSWEVDQGPNWNSNPVTYSGVEAAELLFSSSLIANGDTDFSHYSVSTLGSDPATINHMAWTSTVFVSGGAMHADTYKVGAHYQDAGGTSAYVQDNAIGSAYTNYAFYTPVPEPSSLALAGVAALGLAGYSWVRRSRARPTA